MYQKIVIACTLNVIFSVLTCIVMKPHMFPRSLMHLPFGAMGSFLIHKSPAHGYAYMFMINLYQILELYAHFVMYDLDYSWIDIEGYIVGFTYTTCCILYIKESKYDAVT